MRSRLYPILLGGLDPDALAWKQTVVASSARLALVSQTIRSLKQTGVWPLLDRLWILAGENALQGRTCLKTRNVATPTNGPTFTANRGYTGDGLSSYVDTLFNTLSSGVNFTQDSAHWGVWQTVTGSSTVGNHGNVNTDAGTNGVYADFSASATTRINSASSATNTVVAGVGHLIGNRPSSGSQYLWYNGVKGADSLSASQTRQNFTLWIGGRNLAGSINQASDARVWTAHCGAGLSDAQAVAFYAILLNHKTAIGA